MVIESQNNEIIRQNLALIENERREIAFELHNEIGQNLTAIRTAAQLMHRQSEGRQTHPVAKTIVELTDQMFEMMHHLLQRLHPSVLDKFGLADSLEDLVTFAQENLHLHCTLDIVGDTSVLEKDLQMAVYRIVQEALTNAVRHGYASEANIQLVVRADVLDLLVSNNGVALTGTIDQLILKKTSGIGLLGILHRVQAWQGLIAFENVDEGAKLSCSFPVES